MHDSGIQGLSLEDQHGECKLLTKEGYSTCTFDGNLIINFTARQIFSVQTSYKLNLPPSLILHSSSIKLVETIGQGMVGNIKDNIL